MRNSGKTFARNFAFIRDVGPRDFMYLVIAHRSDRAGRLTTET